MQLNFNEMAEEVVRSDLDQGVTPARTGTASCFSTSGLPRLALVLSTGTTTIRTSRRDRWPGAQLLNAHAACVSTAVLGLMNFAIQPASVTTRDVLSFGNPDSPSVAFGANPISMQLYLARFSTTYSSTFGTAGDWRLVNRSMAMSVDTVRASADLLTSIMRHSDEDLVPLVDLLQRSCTAIGDNNYPLAVVLA